MAAISRSRSTRATRPTIRSRFTPRRKKPMRRWRIAMRISGRSRRRCSASSRSTDRGGVPTWRCSNSSRRSRTTSRSTFIITARCRATSPISAISSRPSRASSIFRRRVKRTTRASRPGRLFGSSTSAAASPLRSGFHRRRREEARQEGHPQLSRHAEGRRAANLCRLHAPGAAHGLPALDRRRGRRLGIRRLVPRLSRAGIVAPPTACALAQRADINKPLA